MPMEAGVQPPVLPQGDLDYVRELVRNRAAIVMGDRTTYLIESRLLQLARAEGFGTVDALVGAARRAVEGVDTRVVEALASGETRFFRDPELFESLAGEAFTERIEARDGLGPRIWCAACSSGQEAYSVAMLLHERFADSLSRGAPRIAASDLVSAGVERTSAGRYSALEVARGLSPERIERWFERDGSGWVAKPELRDLVEPRRINLTDAWPEDLVDLDVVLLRNVLIYLDEAARRDLLLRVAERMARGGWLMLGAGETTLEAEGRFESVRCARGTLYRPR